jgi:short-subunit dehydrogenase
MVSRVIDEFGQIDVLINNAGTIAVGPIEAMKLEAYQYSMDTIFWSAVHTAYYVVPHMQRQGGGRIVNISSIGGKVGVPHLAPYCAGKFAVTGWSRALRGELMKDGIVVTTICPGLMRTGSPRNAEFKGQHQAEYAWFKIGDSLPVLSMSAEHAASRILSAAQQGEVEVVLGLPAKVAVVVDQLFPEISGDLAALAGRLLPAMGGVGTESRRGAESESSASRNILTQSTDRAAERNNEILR